MLDFLFAQSPVAPVLPDDVESVIRSLNERFCAAADGIDPYGPDYRQTFFHFMQQEPAWKKLGGIWSAFRKLFKPCPDEMLVRYALSALSCSEWRWLLYSAVFVRGVVPCSKALQLMEASGERGWGLERFLFDATVQTPYGFSGQGLPNVVDFRFALADFFKTSEEIDLEALYDLITDFVSEPEPGRGWDEPDCRYWTHSYEKKLAEFCRHVTKAKKVIAPMAGDKALDLWAESRKVILFPKPWRKLMEQCFTDPSLAGEPAAVYWELESTVHWFCGDVRRLDFASANGDVERLQPLLAVSGKLGEKTRRQLQQEGKIDWDRPNNGDVYEYFEQHYEPLGPAACRILTELFGQTVPEWARLPAGELAQATVQRPELRALFSEGLLLRLALALDGKDTGGPFDWGRVSLPSVFALFPKNEAISASFAAQGGEGTDPLIWLKTKKRLAKEKKEEISARGLSPAAFEFFVLRHIGTAPWRAAGGESLHKDWEGDLFRFARCEDAVLPEAQRIAFVTGEVMEDPNSPRFFTRLDKLAGLCASDRIVLDWQREHPDSSVLQKVYRKGGSGARDRFINAFIGTDAWKALGGPAVHGPNFAADVCCAVSQLPAGEPAPVLAGVAQELFSSGTCGIRQVRVLLGFLVGQGAQIKSLTDGMTLAALARLSAARPEDLPGLSDVLLGRLLAVDPESGLSEEKFSSDYARGLCLALPLVAGTEKAASFVPAALAVYRRRAGKIQTARRLLPFLLSQGADRRELVQCSHSAVTAKLIEEGTVCDREFVTLFSESTTSRQDCLIARNALCAGMRRGEDILRETAWRMFRPCSLKGLPPLKAKATRLAAVALREHGDWEVMREKLTQMESSPVAQSRALAKAAAALLPVAPFRSGCLSLLAAIGLDCAAKLKFVVSRADWKAEPGRRMDRLYHTWQLPKKSGGKRTISTPHTALKLLQRRILDRLLAPLGAHEAAFGFVPGRSVVDNALPHVGQRVVATTDISNCFPSVRRSLVFAAIRRELSDKLNEPALGLLTEICTSAGGLPIGAPTSPALLNRVLFRTDAILSYAADKRGCRYSRYADDLTFSGDHGAVELLGVAKSTLGRIGLVLDEKKTNIYRRGRRQVCTGLVVNDKVAVPRAVRRRLRAAVHEVQMGRVPQWHRREDSVSALKGRIAFLQSVQPEKAEVLKKRLEAALMQKEPL